MSNISSPFVELTNSFSGIFGNEAYSGVNQLLGVQMKMLDNISAQLDNVQKAVISILENQAELKEVIKSIPSETVAQLYTTKLNGLFLNLRERMSTYVSEKNNNTLTPAEIKSIFGDTLDELRTLRSEIMAQSADTYLNLPFIVNCLHFEIFLMVLSEQPSSFIKIVLASYRSSIENILSSKLKQDFDASRDQQWRLIEESKALFTHNEVQDIIQKINTNGPAITLIAGIKLIKFPVPHHRISISKFNYKLISALDDGLPHIEAVAAQIKLPPFGPTLLAELPPLDEQQAIEPVRKTGEILLLEPLLSSNLLTQKDLPLRFAIDEASQKDYIYDILASNPSDAKPTQIAEDFIIDKSERELATNTRPSNLAINNHPRIDTVKSDELTNNGYSSIIYASLNYMGLEALSVIEKLSATPSNLDMDYLLDFATKQENIVRISNDRINTWVKYVDANIELVKDDAQKAKILEIRNQMQLLRESGRGILQEYAELERKLAEEMPKDLLGGILKLLAPIGRELEKGVQNIVREHEKFVGDLERNLEKAVQDIGTNIKYAGEDVGDLVNAVEGFIENQVRAYGKNLSEAEKRIREWKMVDALWGLGIDPLKSTDDNAAKAFQDSSLLTSIATSVASIYGAPYGGAAFAAWLTYKQTGSLDAALKTAVITYLTQEANASAKSIDTVEISGVVKKTLVTSAIGAAAIAASGWGEKQIIDGFLKGASLSLANEAYKSTTKLDIDGKPPKYLTPYNKDNLLKEKRYVMLDIHGKEVVDITTLSRDVTHVGIADVVNGGLDTESWWPMQLVAQIPFMNDMAYYHDQLCAIYDIKGIDVQLTIIPATMLTFAGSERPLMDQIIQVTKENEEKK